MASPHGHRGVAIGTPPPAAITGLAYTDWLVLPDPSEAGERYELLDGELLVSLTPRIRHKDAVLAIAMALHAHLVTRGGRRCPPP